MNFQGCVSLVSQFFLKTSAMVEREENDEAQLHESNESVLGTKPPPSIDDEGNDDDHNHSVKSSASEDDSETSLDEDDLDLIAENLGHHRRKLVRGGGDSDRSKTFKRIKRRKAQVSESGSEVEEVPQSTSKKVVGLENLFDQEEDEEEEAGGDFIEEEDDFIVDDDEDEMDRRRRDVVVVKTEAALKSVAPRRRTTFQRHEGADDIADIFGDEDDGFDEADFDVQDAPLNAGIHGELESEDTLLEQVYEPSLFNLSFISKKN